MTAASPSFSHWQPRPGTTDTQIIDHVYTRNCYGLPDDMRDYVVVDVGAHVGAFAIACLDRGARVWAYEADPANWIALQRHISAHSRRHNADAFNIAVVRELGVVRIGAEYPIYSANSVINTGGKNIFPGADGGVPVGTETISWIVSHLFKGNNKILLKLDCEGAEHQILTCEDTDWARVDYIIGEAHDATGLDPAFPPTQLLNAQSVVRRLSQLGYRVRYKNARPKGLALFSAARRDSTKPKPLRILWVGDAVAATGFSRCTHAACDALHAAGYDVHVLGMNHYGDPHPYPYPIYPARKGGDWSGVLRLPELVEKLDPDLIVGLNDAWNVRDYLDELNDSGVQLPPIVFWLAADAQNQAAGRDLDNLTHVVAWTQFGVDEFRKGGYRGPASIVPLGVDTSLFRPLDKQRCRARVLPASIGVPPDAFIVGFVGRNQPRKRIDLLLRYFAVWLGTIAITEAEKAYLYLHVAPTGETGTDIRSLTRYYGLEGRVIVSHPPSIGEGVADSTLPYVYGAMDLFLTTTQGEGWGLPVLEAMACGTLCAVPDWSALGEWARPAAYMIPCTSTALSAPLNGEACTIGGVPDERGTVDAIQWAYERARYQQEAGDDPEMDFRSLGLKLARSLSWEKTGYGMVREVEKLLGLGAPRP